MPLLSPAAPDLPGRPLMLAALMLSQAAAVGCTPEAEPPAAADTSTSTTSTTSTTSYTSTTTALDPTSSSSPTTSGGSSTGEIDTSTTLPATCPDGHVDADELCDDGNVVDGDGCNTDCQPSATQLWEYRSSERGTGRVYGIAIDADASIVVGGRGGGLTGWVARFTPELAPQWEQNYGNVFTLVRDVALADGLIYAVGARRSDDDDQDLWVAGLSAEGSLIWEDIVSSGLGDDWATQAAVVEGDLVVTGLAYADQLWTARYGADGAAKWTVTHQLGTTYKDIFPLGPGLAVTPKAVIVGMTGNDLVVAPELLVAYDHDGAASWTAELPGTYGYINAIAEMPGGDLALASVDNFMTLTVRRVSETDEIVWSSDECLGDNARDIAVDSQGDIVVIGDGPGAVGRNIRLCKFTPDGVLRWGKDIDGGVGDDLGYAVAIGPQDRIVAGGSLLTGPDIYDAWLAVFSP